MLRLDKETVYRSHAVTDRIRNFLDLKRGKVNFNDIRPNSVQEN